MGNSLRRIMLSSLPGTAVSHIKIDGVVHEFSAIPGVKEDVTEIVMNIKSLAIKNHSDNLNETKTMLTLMLMARVLSLQRTSNVTLILRSSTKIKSLPH